MPQMQRSIRQLSLAVAMSSLIATPVAKVVAAQVVDQNAQPAGTDHDPQAPDRDAGMMENMPGMGSDDMDMMGPMPGMYGPYLMSREASGTSWQPDSTPNGGVEAMF